MCRFFGSPPVKHEKFWTEMKHPLPSLLVNHGADLVPGPNHVLYLPCLMRLSNPLANIQAHFMLHLGLDGVSELSKVDRLLCSTLYHTWPAFKATLVGHLHVDEGRGLPNGIFPLSEILTQLRNAEGWERKSFFTILFKYGWQDILTPFLGSKNGIPIVFITDWNALQNEDTFGLLASAGIRLNDIEVLIMTLSSTFISARCKDGSSVQTLLDLWEPENAARKFVLAQWLQLHAWYTSTVIVNEDDCKTICDILIDQAFCSSLEHDSRLGVEVASLTCRLIWRGRLDRVDDRSREESFLKLSYLIYRYRPFVDLELSELSPQFCYYPSLVLSSFTSYTPLMLAVTAGHLQLVVLLVSAGANITQTHTPNNVSALDLSCRNISLEHPRTWFRLPSSELVYHEHNNLLVSEYVDIAIYDFLLSKSNQPPQPVPEAPSENASFDEPITSSSLSLEIDAGTMLAIILRILAGYGKAFSILCDNFWLEWRYHKTLRRALEKILPKWLSLYLVFTRMNWEDAAYVLIGFLTCILLDILHILRKRPVLRRFCFAGLILIIGKMTF